MHLYHRGTFPDVFRQGNGGDDELPCSERFFAQLAQRHNAITSKAGEINFQTGYEQLRRGHPAWTYDDHMLFGLLTLADIGRAHQQGQAIRLAFRQVYARAVAYQRQQTGDCFGLAGIVRRERDMRHNRAH